MFLFNPLIDNQQMHLFDHIDRLSIPIFSLSFHSNLFPFSSFNLASSF